MLNKNEFIQGVSQHHSQCFGGSQERQTFSKSFGPPKMENSDLDNDSDEEFQWRLLFHVDGNNMIFPPSTVEFVLLQRFFYRLCSPEPEHTTKILRRNCETPCIRIDKLDMLSTATCGKESGRDSNITKRTPIGTVTCFSTKPSANFV